MINKLIGTVRFVQIQREPLKMGNATERVYDPSFLERVDEIRLTSEGVIGIHGDGEEILDAHHKNHPNSRFRGGNGISVGFTAHYDSMRAQFGDHIPDGIAGENIVVFSDEPYTADDLRGELLIENPDGSHCRFRLNKAMAPCNEFSHFVHQAEDRLPSEILKETLQFLDGGRRGFTLTLVPGDGAPGLVQPGAKLLLQPD